MGRIVRLARIAAGVGAIGYVSICGCLFGFQRQLIFRPSDQSLLPKAENASLSNPKLPLQTVWIDVKQSSDRIHGWWSPAPTPREAVTVLPDEPIHSLRSPKVILFFCGAGGNKSYFLARIAGLRQLGFAVFVIDYRGYGQSQGAFPSEAQMYQDSELAWNYLTQVRRIPPRQIVLYGESLGGAIAINLASKHPSAGGLIVQSSFTTLASVVKQHYGLWLFPTDLLLTQRFDSLSKVRSLQVPVLFIHGTADATIPAEMSRQLYAATPTPKQLHLIAGAEHARIYRPGQQSYLKAIQRFVEGKIELTSVRVKPKAADCDPNCDQ